MAKARSVNWWRFAPDQILEKFADRTFDRRHGTDTSTFVDLSALRIDSDNRRHGERYQPSPVYSLRRLLGRLDIDYPRFSYIDFGCGKGRTLLIAGELPFRQVVGVEFGAQLQAQAEQNIARYRHRAAQSVVAMHGDATHYTLPDDNLVLYFFNPFGREVLDKVLANLNASLQARTRRVFLIYLYLPDKSWLSALDGFRLREQWRNYLVYEYQPS
jgi:SAM-dependent methyltransferase